MAGINTPDDITFQSTLPARGATSATRRVLHNGNFNPRSPHGERLRAYRAAQFVAQISIHAPRTGSDMRARWTSCLPKHFNPRSPHGERP